MPFIERIRALCDEHGAIFTMAEIGGDKAEKEMKAYTSGNHRLNSAYGFDFLYADRLTPQLVREAAEQWPDAPGLGWPSWAFENHDAPRAISRWAPPASRDAYARMKMLLLACLRGNIFLYNGEELGLGQVDIPFEALQDPEAIANWPLTLSRDGARTPMPWQREGAGHGFTTGTPWLPFGDDNIARAVDAQNDDQRSMLNWTRRVLALRTVHPALRQGGLSLMSATDRLLVFERSEAGERLVCAFNLSDTPVDAALDDQRGWTPVIATGTVEGTTIGPWSGLIARYAE